MSAAPTAPTPSPSPPLIDVHSKVQNPLLTAEDLAARWQVPRSQVSRLCRVGALPVVRLGRYRRFRLNAVERFEAEGGVDADD